MTPRWRLFPKYTAIIIAVVGSLLVASGAIGVWFSYRETESHIVALQVEKAENAAERIERFVLDIEHQLSWTALPPVDTGGDPLEQRRIEYYKLFRQVPAITEIAWIDPQGKEQLRVSRLAMDSVRGGADLSREPKFRDVVDNRCAQASGANGAPKESIRSASTFLSAAATCVYFSPVYFRKDTEPFMTIARPAGSGGGVTAAEVNLKFVWDVVSRIRIGEHGLAYVLDRTGTLIAHPDISLVLKKSDLSGLPQVAALAAAASGAPAAGGSTVASALGRDLRGQEVFSARAPIPTLRWNVFVESPRDEALAPLYATIARAASVLAAGLVVSVVASFFVARALVRPLRALQEGAERIGAGELDRRIEVKTGDELEGLADRFNAMAGALKASYADLERKVEVRTAELTEALEQQTAMAEILKVISQSPSNVQPVFDAISESARRLCDAVVSGVGRVQGDKVELVAYHGATPAAAQAMLAQFPLPVGRGSNLARAIFERRTVQIPDVEADPDYTVKDGARRAGYRSGLAVPLMRESEVIGAIAVCRAAPGLFPDRLVRLLQTFADQAVIAIENVRLFNETKESLERQTATSNVLAAISSAQTDATPVFETIARNAHRLSGSVLCNVLLYEGKLLHMAACDGFSPEQERELRRKYPVEAGDASVLSGRVVLSGQIEQIEDVLTDPRYDHAHAAALGTRRMLGVPMVRDGAVQGVIVLAWRDPGLTPPALVELLKTFADQAVIAIENVRLFNETNEALERQTATAEVLRVISGSVADSAPVFEKILESCAHLFSSSEQGILLTGDDGRIHLGSHRGSARERLQPLFPTPRPAGASESLFGRRVLHYADVLAEPGVPAGIRAVAERIAIGTYSQVFVPLLWEDRPIGSLYVIRQPPTGFSEKEIDLLRTFADQAVIAIQNARLFRETREALDRQTATSDVLRVISESPTDVQPVFDAIASSGVRLFRGAAVAVSRAEAGQMRSVAIAENNPERAARWRAVFPFPIEPSHIHGAAMLECRVIDVPDVLEAGGRFEAGKRNLAPAGYRAMTVVPMVREQVAIGAIAVVRVEPGPLSADQIGLLETFADQAVIAIENVRLFNETREALRKVELRTAELTEALDYQTAISDVLRVISQSPTDVAPVFEAILDSASRLFGSPVSAVFRFDGRLVHLAATRNWPPEAILDSRRFYPGPPNPAMMSGRVILSGTVQSEDDALRDPAYVRQAAGVGHWRRMVGAPLLKDGQPIGAIVVAWPDPGVTPQRQADLLKTFADQAVIAIENVRLLSETTEALEQQTATAEILQVISRSVADSQPVFEAILRGCERLFNGAHMGVTLLGDDGRIHLRAHLGPVNDQSDFTRNFPFALSRDSGSGSAILTGEVVAYEDVHEPDVPAVVKVSSAAAGTRSIIFAPLVWQGRGMGAIFVARRPAGAFSVKDVALIRTFADQAVIAIQNARLFNETREALERQTAMAGILSVISSSPTDTAPVFEAIVQSCQRLFGGLFVAFARPHNGALTVVAHADDGTDRGRAGSRLPPWPLDRASAAGTCILEARVVNVADTEGAVEDFPRMRDLAIRLGYRSGLFVPLLRDERAIGAIVILRAQAGAFNEREVNLARAFADQAVIAIENVRLFNEIQDKSRQLELANKHKSEFLANMSHELRTPLNAIIGFSEVLAEQMFGDVNEKQLEYLKDIHTSGQHLLSLINDILDLSKIEAGRMELDLATVNLPLLLDNCTTLVRERASRQGLTLALEVEDDVGDWVADVRKVKQVVINLLSNAVKFTPAGGRVTLRARLLGDEVEIAVVDTGVGIAPDQQALVFEEFRQAGGDYLRKAEGTGLGLSLAKRFVELHGGRIRVESAPGRGSTFAFVLPYRAAVEPAALQA